MGFADKVTNALEDPGPFKLYLYGDAGCGKTVFAATAPNPLILDCERSRRSLLNHPELAHIPIKKVITFEDAQEVIFAARAKDKFFDDIDTIVVDTIDRLQRTQLNEELRDAVAKNSNRHPHLPSENEYNINNRIMEKLVLGLLDLDKNVIFVGHTKEEKDDNGNTVLIRPGTSPAFTKTLIDLVDGVFYMTASTDSKGVTTRKVRFLPSRQLVGKNRLGTLPVEVQDPSFEIIVDAANKQRELVRSFRAEPENDTILNIGGN